MALATTVAPAAPVEVVTPIKPSEALRLGRLIRPEKCSGDWFDGDRAACAIGAIAVGWGYGTDDDGQCDAFQRFESLDIPSPAITLGSNIFDHEEHFGRDGDAAVLAYLESRGL